MHPLGMVVMAWVCLGCGKTFKTNRSHSLHIKACTQSGRALGSTLQKRHAEGHEEREAKRLRMAEADAMVAIDDIVVDIPEVPEPPDPATLSRSGRVRKVPAKLKEFLPSSLTGLPTHLRPEPVMPDRFGLYRVYTVKPQRDPCGVLSWEDICDPIAFPTLVSATTRPEAPVPHGLDRLTAPPWAPFPNVTTFDLVHWQNNGSNLKSHGQMNSLASVMQLPGFNTQDVDAFDSAREVERLDNFSEMTQGSPLSADDRWKTGSARIRLPKEGVPYRSEDDAPEFLVPNVHHRSLVDVASAACQHPSVKDWTFIPYKLFWLDDSVHADQNSSRSTSPDPSDSDSSTSDDFDESSPSRLRSHSAGSPGRQPAGTQVYSEVWHAEAWHEEDAEMRSRPREAGDSDDLEYAILPMKLYSDSTHLTDFGHASLWPIYVYFLTQSKYMRGRPTMFPAHHLAYIPSLPDTLQDFYLKIYGIAATAAVLTYLKRELVQQIWLLLLDERLMYAYVHGMVLLCGDGVRRRLFLRFLMYAADYPEKILLACLKYFAACPCPRCRINKDKIIEMGTMNDLHRRNWVRLDNNDVLYRIKVTRRWLFEDGLALTSKYMARILDPLSITPTRFELGVWKSTWIHLLRILYAVGNDRVQELNWRFRHQEKPG
ncbi:hypothetical protein BN946_scf184935.g2 [Trametes cinnabarina]|uniref:Uncharacterized protein n=1 Tax=Pycnoporus cinnabarinus TaxID=5643 RepID=A0A060SMQ6_PYCCI|nr:hypothetical protein BN946_scf184935.g2 [Trametes cinnabarina]